MAEVRVGTAGWAIPALQRARFGEGGSTLERYGRVFRVAEINSSFHRPHRPSTYARWAAAVPDGFRFSAKLPREITHARRLIDAAEPLAAFLEQSGALRDRLGPLLVQLPPSLVFESIVAERFLAGLRDAFAGQVACEPRHASWFDAGADALLAAFEVARVAADPARVPAAAEPGGWAGFAYWRLHGSPAMYRSAYEPGFLDELARRVAARAVPSWCMFDNTTLGHATADALALQERFMSGALPAA